MEEQTTGQLHFVPSAYLQRLIGRDLISSDYIAVTELVKNAYDAGATEVDIELIGSGSERRLIISDNGPGMSLEEFQRLWMSPGYSEKDDNTKLKVEGEIRTVLGEKGIGRFAADKLASILIVSTKKSGKAGADKALRVEFNWEDFNTRTKKLADVPISYSMEPTPPTDRYRSWTILELRGLRSSWELPQWRKLRTSLHNLIPPFRTKRTFKIVARAAAWPKYSGEIASPFNTGDTYKYEFSLSKGGHLSWKFLILQNKGGAIQETVLDKGSGRVTTSFGPVVGTFFYVKRPGPLTKLSYEAGVGLYRDGFRVEPYGRPSNDWIKVQSSKASQQGKAPITPSRLFGFIEISRVDNPKLRDTTSREGLLETQDFLDFQLFVRDQFDEFAEKVDKDNTLEPEPAPQYVAQTERNERITKAEAFATMAAQMAHQLRQPLNNIQLHVGTLRLLLDEHGTLSAQEEAGIDTIERNIERMDTNIKYLAEMAVGLKEEYVEINLGQFIQRLVSLHIGSFNQQGVQLHTLNCGDGYIVRLSLSALNWILENFLKNAFEAAIEAPDKPGRVVIEIEVRTDNGYRVKVTDNGPGVPAIHEDKIFNDALPSAYGGMGMGLFWSSTIAIRHGLEINYVNVQPSGAMFYIDFPPVGDNNT